MGCVRVYVAEDTLHQDSSVHTQMQGWVLRVNILPFLTGSVANCRDFYIYIYNFFASLWLFAWKEHIFMVTLSEKNRAGRQCCMAWLWLIFFLTTLCQLTVWLSLLSVDSRKICPQLWVSCKKDCAILACNVFGVGEWDSLAQRTRTCLHSAELMVGAKNQNMSPFNKTKHLCFQQS